MRGVQPQGADLGGKQRPWGGAGRGAEGGAGGGAFTPHLRLLRAGVSGDWGLRRETETLTPIIRV